jgi:hypothetical protein
MDLLFIGVASMMGERENTWSGRSLAFDTCITECQEEPGKKLEAHGTFGNDPFVTAPLQW